MGLKVGCMGTVSLGRGLRSLLTLGEGLLNFSMLEEFVSNTCSNCLVRNEHEILSCRRPR